MNRQSTPLAIGASLLVALLAAGLPTCLHGADSGSTPIGHSGDDTPPEVSTNSGTGRTLSPFEVEATGKQAGSPGEEDDPVPEPYASQILWGPPETGDANARFLPEAFLQETSLENWPIAGWDRARLRESLSGWEDFKRKVEEVRGVTPERCTYAAEPHPPASASTASTLEDQVLHHRQLTFVGSVVSRVLGLQVANKHVMTMVYVRVEEVLHDTEQRVHPGDVISFLWSTGGRIELAHGLLCTFPPRRGDEFLWELGDTLVIAADFLHHYDGFVSPGILAPLQDGTVHVRESPFLLETEIGREVRLVDLRDAIEHRSSRGSQ